MKTTLLPKHALPLTALFLAAGVFAQGQLPFKPLGGAPANAEEQQQLNWLFAQARAASAGVPPGPDAGAQRQAVADGLDRELEFFVGTHTNSMWTPPVRLWLAQNALRHVGYSAAMEHSALAWAAVRDSQDPATRMFALEASGRLARLLAMTGRLSELEVLETQVRQQVPDGPFGGEWAQATELRQFVLRYPTAAYKCGLECLDQLGRLTQPGQFRPADILKTDSTTNGFSAAELVAIANRVGLGVHAAMFNDLTNPPVPCILHLRSDHFVVLREQRGAFYEVHDPANNGPRWVTGTQIAAEASGCVIVSDLADPGLSMPMDPPAAATYRGRVYATVGWDHGDSPCPGSSGPAGNSIICSSCIGPPPPKTEPVEDIVIWGMPVWVVSEPWLNLWLLDRPLSYRSAFGPEVDLLLAFKPRHTPGVVSGAFWHGSLFGNYGGYSSQWNCSWLSFAELSDNEYTADVLLPGGGWATFSFADGSSFSAVNFRHRLILEKQGSGAITNLVMHYPNGARISYGLKDANVVGYGLFYMTRQFDPTGNYTGFTYDPSYLLTNVIAADGASFTLQYDEATQPSYITSVTASYGATVSLVTTLPRASPTRRC